jgi:hypothetical protein
MILKQKLGKQVSPLDFMMAVFAFLMVATALKPKEIIFEEIREGTWFQNIQTPSTNMKLGVYFAVLASFCMAIAIVTL